MITFKNDTASAVELIGKDGSRHIVPPYGGKVEIDPSNESRAVIDAVVGSGGGSAETVAAAPAPAPKQRKSRSETEKE